VTISGSSSDDASVPGVGSSKAPPQHWEGPEICSLALKLVGVIALAASIWAVVRTNDSLPPSYGYRPWINFGEIVVGVAIAAVFLFCGYVLDILQDIREIQTERRRPQVIRESCLRPVSFRIYQS
jgi:hypothetical protein